MKHVELCNSIHKNESARNRKLHLKLILETTVQLLGSVRGVDPQENRITYSKMTCTNQIADRVCRYWTPEN